MEVRKSDLIKQLSSEYGYTKKSAANLVDDFCYVVLSNLESGNTIDIRGFGCFDIIERKERTCPSPVDGKPVVIPTHYISKFYPGNAMKRAVKIWEDNEKRGLNNG